MLKRKLDDLWSKYVRMSEAHSDGRCTCVSCGQSAHWKDMDCGHFVSRNHNLGRFRRENCHAQCVKCNRFREGCKSGYALYLIKTYGPDIIEELHNSQFQVKRFTVSELQGMIRDTQEKIKALKNVPQD